jgi:hypothetical protein
LSEAYSLGRLRIAHLSERIPWRKPRREAGRRWKTRLRACRRKRDSTRKRFKHQTSSHRLRSGRLHRAGEKGLKWEEYDGETINVRRKIWNDHVGAPKTEAREAGVYVVPLLCEILAKYKTSYPSVGEGCIFRGQKMLRPLDLDNLSRRGIPRYINGAWCGWHAFRRGLGTRLNGAGVDDSEIQSILRHADVSTTARILYSAESGTDRGGVEETRQNFTHEVRYKRIEAWAPSSMVRAIGS